MDQTKTAKVRQAIAETRRSRPAAADPELARLVKTGNPELVNEWMDEKLLFLVREETRKAQPPPGPGPYQMFLEGFENMQERLPILHGRRIPLAKATLSDLRKSYRMTRHQAKEKTERIVQLIREMEPYARTRRGLTVERYCELRAAGVTARAAKKTHAARD